MCDILKDSIDNYGVIGTKAEFEAEGTRLDELLRLFDISNKAGCKMALKIGGCEAITDLNMAKQFGVDYVIAPMVETSYSLKKFIGAIKTVYKNKDLLDTEFLFNCETITTYKNIDEMINVCNKNKDIIHGITFGRVDFVNSQGISREKIEIDEISESVIEVSKKCKKNNLDFVVGGAIYLNAIENLKKFHSIYLTRFETRKIVFSGEAALADSLHEGIKNAHLFTWRKNRWAFSEKKTSEC